MEQQPVKEFEFVSQKTLLQYVKECADWIEQFRHDTGNGSYWEVQPDNEPDRDAVLLSQKSLYGGSAGIALFYLRLYVATGEIQWLEKAEQAAEYIMATYEGIGFYETVGKGTMTGIPTGLLNGPAGGGYVAELLYEQTKKPKYREYAESVTDDLVAAAKFSGDGMTWSGAVGIIADGGLILYLLKLYEATGKKEYLETAQKAGTYLASKAEEAPQGGLRWYAMDSEAFGLGSKGYFPGFFYGTAGSAYILACLYEVTNNEEFLEYAKKGAEYLIAIALENRRKHAALIRYNDPYQEDLFYLGMCQGPVGTSRLFYKLYQITGEVIYKEWVVKLTNGILAAGAPAKHSRGYWHTYCYCCGAAGMLEHFLHVYQLTGDEIYLEAAKEAADVLIRDSFAEDGKRRWYTAWNRHLPAEVDAFTGLYQGTAGCASALLTYYNYRENKEALPGYIEDPF